MEGGHAVSLLLVRSLSVSHSHTLGPPHAHLVIAGGVCLFEIALNPVTVPPEGPHHFSSDPAASQSLKRLQLIS